jgi:hypothetical protein
VLCAEEALLDGHLEATLVVLKKRAKDWKEGNLNVVRELLAFIAHVAEKHVLTRRSFAIVAPFIFDKLGDSKFTDVVGNIILQSAAACAPTHVATLLLQHVTTQKKGSTAAPPKVLQDAGKALAALIETFTLRHLPLMELVNFAKELLGNSNTAVRASGSELLRRLYE